MSEIITGGIAAAALSTCVAAAAAGVAVAYATYRALSWLSGQAQRELERLEGELATPLPTHATPVEARRTFESQLTRIQVQLAKNPILNPHRTQVARVLALKHSGLDLFLNENEWKRIQTPAQPSFATVVKNATQRFTQANALHVSRSIAEVAQSAGFTRQRLNRISNGTRFLVMEDELGRALVTEVEESEEGAKINLDLTGFGDGSCHAAMDEILSGLAQKGVRLDGIRRRSHYRREGALHSASESVEKSRRREEPEAADLNRRKTEQARRRQRNRENRRLKQDS